MIFIFLKFDCAGYTYPPQNPYPPAQEGYPGYPPPYSGGVPPPGRYNSVMEKTTSRDYLFIEFFCFYTGPGFIPPPGAPPYGQAPPPVGPEFGAPPVHPGMYGSGYAEDPLQDEVKGFEFNDKSIRNGFIR